MPIEVVTALCALCGTIIGTFGGIVTSARLTNYRIEQLEKRVEEMNKRVETVPILTTRVETLEREVSKGA